MTRPLPQIAPCPFCGGKPRRFTGLGHKAVGCFNRSCVVQPCASADENDNTQECADRNWNRRSDAEAERKGAMAVADWFEKRWPVSSGDIRKAIERGEVLPATRSKKGRKRT